MTTRLFTLRRRDAYDRAVPLGRLRADGRITVPEADPHPQPGGSVGQAGSARLHRQPSPRRLRAALVHESSRTRTMLTDRILTCRCDMTRVGRGRSSDSGSHSRGRPHSPAQLDSGREDHRR